MNKLTFIILAVISFSTLSAQSKWAYIICQADHEPRRGILLDDGSELISPIYERIIFTDNHFYFTQNNKWGVIDSAGRILIQPQYDRIGLGISEGLIRVKRGDKWGYIDISGETVLDFKYDFACNFRNGKAYVIDNNEPMFISKNGEKIESTREIKDYCFEDLETELEIETQFDSDTLIMIKESEGKFGVVDTNERVIIPIKFHEIGLYYNDIIKVRKGNLWGAYKNNGDLIVEPKYTYIGLFNNWK